MVFRIFIGLIALICLYFSYSSIQLSLVKSSVRHAEDGYAMTAKEADLTVVEFLDYSCVHCQSLHPSLLRALQKDGNVTYIPRPIPSGAGGEGTKAARLAYAAGRQGKFIEAHNLLIENFRAIDGAYISNFALELGLDTSQLEEDMQDPEIEEALQSNLNNLKKLGGKSIPTMMLGKRLMLSVGEPIPTSEELIGYFNRARML